MSPKALEDFWNYGRRGSTITEERTEHPHEAERFLSDWKTMSPCFNGSGIKQLYSTYFPLTCAPFLSVQFEDQQDRAHISQQLSTGVFQILHRHLPGRIQPTLWPRSHKTQRDPHAMKLFSRSPHRLRQEQ